MPNKDHHIESQALLYLIENGDENAFAKLYTLFANKLIAFASAIVHSKEIAEEVVEDVFVKIWNRRGHLCKIENITVYLYTAVKNQSLSALSDKANKLITESFDELDTTVEALHQDPHAVFITSEMLNRVNRVIDSLPPRCKIIFKLIREDGLRYKEVSEILNISVNTIDVQMAIAVKKICEAMGVTKTTSFSTKNIFKKNIIRS